MRALQEKFGELGVFMIVCNARPSYYMADNAADWVTEVTSLDSAETC